MDASAIKEIQETAILAASVRPDGIDPESSIFVMPSSFKVVNAEGTNLHRDRFRGSYETKSIPDFLEYVKLHGEVVADTKGFIDTTNDEFTAKAFFNLTIGDLAGHADDVAILTLEQTPEFAALTKIENVKIKQRALSDFVEDWAHVLTPFDANGVAIETKKALNSIRNVKISRNVDINSSVHDSGRALSAAEQVELVGQSESLPSFFTLRTSAYHGLSTRELDIRFIRSDNDNEPVFTLQIIRRAQVMENLATDFKHTIAAELQDYGTFLIGTFTP